LIRAEVNCPPRWLNKNKKVSLKQDFLKTRLSKQRKHKMAVQAESDTSFKQYKNTKKPTLRKNGKTYKTY